MTMQSTDAALTRQWPGSALAAQNTLARFAAVLLVVSLIGCGRSSSLERIYVSGKATYQGKPIELGQIRFVPDENTRAPITVEQVRDGEYATSTSGGVPVGTHQVEIRMYDPEEYRTAPRTAGSPAVKQLLPNKFNRETELTIKVESGSGSIERDFLLED